MKIKTNNHAKTVALTVSLFLVAVATILADPYTVATTNGAGGGSGYIQNQANTSSFGGTSFHVKNDGNSTVTRKGYVRFDTSGLGFVPDEAALSMTVHLIDAAIADNDQTLYVYGITDQSLDLVALTNGLDWAAAPGNDSASWHAADLAKADLLGTFVVDYNGDHASPAGTVVEFSSVALTDFVNTDTNDLVTFLIGRKPEGGSGSANLLFAGDTHATYAPPTLTLGTSVPLSRPFIWVRDSEKSQVLAKISSNSWAGTIYSGIVSRVQSDLSSWQSDRDAYIRELPAIWTTPAYDISGGASDPKNYLMYPIQSKYNAALDGAVLYYLTGNTNYAQFASDILHNGVQCTLGVTPSTSTGNGGWIFHDDLLYEARVIGNPLPVIYDFMYTYLQTNQVYDVKSTGMVDFSFSDAQSVFRGYYEIVRDHGDASGNNWSALMSSCMIHNLLALDTESEREAALEVYLTTGGVRQSSLADDYVNYPTPSSVWPESLNYAINVAQIRSYHMVLIERYDTNRNLFATYPNLPESLSRIRELRYPNRELIRFGDGSRTEALPLLEYELAYRHAKDRGYTALANKMGAFINAAIDDGEYSRSSLQNYSNLTPHNEPLQLLWQLPEVTEPAGSFTFPRTDILPYAGIALQRNLSPGGDPDYGLMAFVGGAAHVHNHAGGMNMELYGMGEVMGAKGGKSTYGTPLHENYYRLYAGHNTVIVNGASRGEDGWVGLGMNTVTTLAMEPGPLEAAISSNFSFTCSSFLDNKGTLAEATQQRTLAIIRTSQTNGFYVDFFRSKSTVENRTAVTLDGPVTDQYHDYIYRNIGVLNSVETNGTALPLVSQPSRFQNDIGDSYDQPGWLYFTNTVVSYPHTAQFEAQYVASPTAGPTVYMDMHMPAVAEREVAKVDAPSIKDAPDPYDGQAAETIVVRQIGDTWEKPFVTVFEPHYGATGGTITNTTPLWRSGTVVGVRVDSVLNGSNVTHFIISNPGADESYSDPVADLYFTGRLGVVSDYGAGNTELYIGDGTSLSYKGESIGLAQTTVPDVVGMVQASAENAITATNLVVGVVSSVYDEVVATGSVISQDPTGGVVLAEGSSVDLVVSLGPAPAPSAYRLLFADNFDSADSGDVSAGVAVPGRQSGDLATATYDEWTTPAGISIVSGELLTGSGSGLAGNLDFRSSLTNAALFDGFNMRFDMRNTGSSWVAYFLSTHIGVDDRAGSEFGFHIPQDGAGNGVILYGGIGAGQVSTDILRSTLTLALGSTFNASDLHDYRFVATPVTDTTGTYDFYVDGVLIHSGKDYVLGPGGGNGEINWESRVNTGGNGYLDNLELSTFIIPPAGTVLIVR